MSDHILEVVLFQTADGVSDAEFLAAAKGVEPWLQQVGGFVDRELSKDADGNWLDLIHWESLEQAQAAAAQIMARPEGQAFGAAINGPTIRMYHMHPVHRLP